MIKLKDVVEKYGDFEVDEEKLKKLLVQSKSKTIWDLELEDKYYYIGSDGNIYSTYYVFDWLPTQRINVGNVFLTIEEAEFEVERRKCESIMLKYGTRDMMSLNDEEDFKYYISYDYHNNKLYIDYNQYMCKQGIIYFKTEWLCKKAINEIGEERLKKYIFNVKE